MANQVFPVIVAGGGNYDKTYEDNNYWKREDSINENLEDLLGEIIKLK